MSVARLREEMTSREFVQWLAYFKLKNEREEKRREKQRHQAELQKQRTQRIGGGRRS